MKRIALIAVGLMLFGCGSPSRVVILQHPETKQTVKCEVDPWGHINRTLQIDDCVNAYQKAGFKPVGDSSGIYN